MIPGERRCGARPAFVTSADDVDRLIFDTRCVHNLATYLNPRRPQVTELGKVAMVVKGCDVKAVAGLLREAQLTRDRLVLDALGASGAVLACEYESPASSAMQNATPVPKVAFRQAAKPVVAPVSKQAAAPATKTVTLACEGPSCRDAPLNTTTTGKKSVVLASVKAPMPKD